MGTVHNWFWTLYYKFHYLRYTRIHTLFDVFVYDQTQSNISRLRVLLALRFKVRPCLWVKDLFSFLFFFMLHSKKLVF